MSEILARASDDDVAAIARRRFRDSETRRLYLYLASAAPNGAWVARDEGTAIGIAIAHQLETEWYLSDLFVEPSFRHQGLGSRLLAEAARDSGDVTRSGFVDPADHGGIAFLARRRVPARTPVLRIAGRIPKEEQLTALAAGEHRFATETLDPLRHRSALDALDRETRGSARHADHLYFASNAGGSAFFEGGELVGYAYVWPDGRIGPLASFSPSYLIPFFAFGMLALARTHGASWCRALVPAVNVRVTRAALDAGLKIEAVKLFARDSDEMDMSRYIGYHSLLY
ncbi:MAG: GNAT family N-acetyltransferase [Candidatus Eremiobacteraeota bacterium]|nr:GNAT family N-acetyltransferase [Candidatus Eremiobacteraeota bacterium]